MRLQLDVVEIHIHHHADQRVVDKLDLLLAGQEITMDIADKIISEVQEQKTLAAGMKTFIGGLKSQIAEALAGAKLSAEHEAKLAAIFPDLEANNDALASAMATTPEGGPVEPPPVPEPAPEPAPAPVDESKPSA